MNPDNLPELKDGWAWALLPDLAANKNHALKAGPFGSTLKKSFYVPTGYKVYGQEQVIKNDPYYGNYYIDADRFKSLASCAVEAGDILISLVGTIGKVLILPEGIEPGIINPRLVKLSLDKRAVFNNYIKLYLESKSARRYFSISSHGGTMEILNLKILKSLPIPTPPINEQRRIVEKIEELRAHTLRSQQALDEIPALIDQFRQSVLAAAFRGDLTADWRKKNPDVEHANNLLVQLQQAHELIGGHKQGNAASPTDGVHNLKSEDFPKTWEVIELRDICKPNKPITYGILKPGPDLEQGIPYIRVADFPNNNLNLSNIRKTSQEIEEKYSRSRLEQGDLLLSIRGTVGRICQIPTELQNANITQDSARLSIQKIVNSDYASWMIQAKPTQKRMEQATKGVAVRGINIGDVRALQIPLPPRLEQEEIVRKIQCFMQIIDSITKQYVEASKFSEQINQSILAKAFRGELVPQDPNDEPASVLLDRIRTEREKLGTTTTKKRSSRKRSQ